MLRATANLYVFECFRKLVVVRLDATFYEDVFERCLEVLADEVFFLGEKGSKDEIGLDGGGSAGNPVDPHVSVLS